MQLEQCQLTVLPSSPQSSMKPARVPYRATWVQRERPEKETVSQQDMLVTSLPRRQEEAHHVFLFPTSMPPSCLQTSSVVVKQCVTLVKDIAYLAFFPFWMFRKPDLPVVYFYTNLLVCRRIQIHIGLFIKTTQKYRIVRSR